MRRHKASSVARYENKCVPTTKRRNHSILDIRNARKNENENLKKSIEVEEVDPGIDEFEDLDIKLTAEHLKEVE